MRSRAAVYVLVSFEWDAPGYIAKVPKAGGGATKLVTDSLNPKASVVDGQYVYWTEPGRDASHEGRIRRIELFADLLGRHRADFEPLLTRSVSGPASLPGLVTDPSELQKLRLPMPLHAGLSRSPWGWLRDWRYQLPFLALVMAAQIVLLLRLRPVAATRAAAAADTPGPSPAPRLSDSAATVIAAAIAAAASIAVTLLKP